MLRTSFTIRITKKNIIFEKNKKKKQFCKKSVLFFLKENHSFCSLSYAKVLSDFKRKHRFFS